jgi:hypothetical protein
VSLSFSFRISPSSICKILREVFQSIVKILQPLYLSPPTSEDFLKIEFGFRNCWNFPNCIGAVDGKHCRIQAPNFSGSTHYNYKGFHSIVLMAIVDSEYRFILVDIGRSGSQSDGGVFNRSEIGKRLADGTLGVPPSKLVDSKLLPHVIVADDAFALKPYIMKPFPGQYLTIPKRIFNYRLSRARNVVENSFGLLAARWRVFHTPISGELDLATLIVNSAVILHNYLLSKNDLNQLTVDSMPGEIGGEGNWRAATLGDTGLVGINQQGSNNFGAVASKVREEFCEYFNSEIGSVSWQKDCISC